MPQKLLWGKLNPRARTSQRAVFSMQNTEVRNKCLLDKHEIQYL